MAEPTPWLSREQLEDFMGYGQYSENCAGRRTKGEMLYWLDWYEMTTRKSAVKTRKTAHNEVTVWFNDGTTIVRFLDTDILRIDTDGTATLNAGQWHTPTTRGHMMSALDRHGFKGSLWGSTRGEDEASVYCSDAGTFRFRRTIRVTPDGMPVEIDGVPAFLALALAA